LEKLDKHYGLRVCCISLVWFALGGTIINTEDQVAFLSALVLFLLPLAYDYLNQQPILEKNKKRKALGLWSCIFLATLLLGLTFGGFDLRPIINWRTEFISFKVIVWLLFLYYVYMAAQDWVAYSSSEEVEHRERVRKLQRGMNEYESVVDRTEYYRDRRKNTPRRVGPVDHRKEEKTGTDNE
jgi:hypothetical protein